MATASYSFPYPTTASASKMQPGPAPLLEPAAVHTSASRRQPDHAPAANTELSSLLKLSDCDISSCPMLLESAEAQARAEATISKNLPRAVLNMKHRLDEHQCSLASLQDQLSKLRDKLSSLIPSIVPTPASSTTAPTPDVSFTPSSESKMVVASPSVYSITATTSVPSMFCATTGLSVSSLHPPSDAPPSAYAAPQLFGEMPQHYDFHNLNHKIVFLSDGSEHSYFAPPENYPLGRAVLAPVFDVYEDETEGCSSKSVDVFVRTGGQQIYEEEQQGEQLLKCLSKALETEHTSACLNTTSDVRDFTLELQQQDARRAFSCSVLKVYDSLVTRSTQLGIEHSMRQLRLQWNPGVHSIPYSTTNIDTVGFLQNSILPRSGVSIHTDLLLAGFQFGVSRCCVPRQCYGRLKTRLINHRIHFLWDPGILSLMGMMLGKNAVTNLVYRSETSIKLVFFIDQPVDMKHFLFQLLLQFHWWCHTLNAFPKVQYCHLPIVWYCPYTSMFSSTKAIHFALSMSTARTVRMILVLSFERSAHEGRDEAVVYKVLILQLPWDTGVQNIISMMLDKYTLPRQVQFVQQTSELLFLSLRACIQYVAPKSTNSVRHATCFILGRDVHLTQFNYRSSLYCKSALKTSYVWDPGVKTSLHNWLGILTVRSATDKPLSCTHIPDLAAGQNSQVAVVLVTFGIRVQ